MGNLVVTGVDEEEADSPEADAMLGLRLLVPERENARVVTADRLLNKLAASPTFARLAISLQDTAAN